MAIGNGGAAKLGDLTHLYRVVYNNNPMLLLLKCAFVAGFFLVSLLVVKALDVLCVGFKFYVYEPFCSDNLSLITMAAHWLYHPLNPFANT